MSDHHGWPDIIAVVGLTGAGKSEATRWLKGLDDYREVYFGGIVVDEVHARGLESNPENERIVREELREHEGMQVMAERSLPKIDAYRSEGHRVVIDGLYSAAEQDTLKSHYHSSLVTLAVHAPKWLRKERLEKRPIRPLSRQEVDNRDQFEVRNLDKAMPIALADLHVVNDRDLESLKSQIRCALDKYSASQLHT